MIPEENLNKLIGSLPDLNTLNFTTFQTPVEEELNIIEKMSPPLIAVIGSSQSGKTAITVELTTDLVKRGYKVGTIKHIPKPDFTIDTPEKDTWRHAKAGATVVISVAPQEITVIRRGDKTKFGWNDLQGVIKDGEVDVIIAEGFRGLAKADEQIPKIIAVKTKNEAVDTIKECKNVLAIVGFIPQKLPSFQKIPYFKAPDKLKELADLVENQLKPQLKLRDWLQKLPGLNCKACGFNSCSELAKAIVEGKATIEKCRTLKEKRVTMKIDDKTIPMNPFVQDVARSIVLGFVSILKDTKIKGDETIQITIQRPRN